MERQQFSFSWADHSQFAPNAFRDLFGVEAFSDVTLACSDDQQLYAHRIILSSCSPFFRNLLLKNPHKNTLVYLKGISSTEMQAILKFIYQGSCEVGAEDLKGFLEAGKELQIEGLQDYVEQRNMDESWSEGETHYDLVEDSIHSELFYSEKFEVLESKLNQPKHSKKVKAQELETTFDNNGVVQIISEKEDEMFLDNTIELEPFVGIKCNECSYKAPDYLDLKRHKEKIHENNVNVNCVNVQCKECDYTAIDNPNLKQHELEMHAQATKKRYSCNFCDFQANFSTNFKKHMENTHTTTYDNNDAVRQSLEKENVKCFDKTVKSTEWEQFNVIKVDKIKSTASEFTDIKKHKEETLEKNVNLTSAVVKCKECDYTALDDPNLRQHEQEMHTAKEICTQITKKRYNCDKCDYQANFATSYKKHMENTHKTAYNIFKWSKD